MKRTCFFCFLLLSGIVLGALIAEMCAGLPLLGWLAYSNDISFHPVLDLNILRLDLDLYMGISVAQIITITGSFLIYRHTKL